MFHAFLPLLLIINLLACPLRCTLCEAGAADVEQAAAPTCSCCLPAAVIASEHAAPTADAPWDCPQDECQCQNCICEGATLQSGPELPDASLESVDFLTPPLVASLALSDPHHLLEERISPHPRCHDSGRAIRVAYRSLLI